MLYGNIDYSKVGRNIRNLRSAYGESALDLILLLDLKSPSTIYNYEKGDRKPTRDILVKIAEHYRITTEELINGDFSHISFDSSKTNRNALTQRVEELFKISFSPSAEQDTLFKKGYDLHIQLFRQMDRENDIDYNALQECIDSYEASFAQNNTIEAAINLLWWFFFLGVNITFRVPDEVMSDILSGKMSIGKGVKETYLHHFDEDENEAAAIEQTYREFLSEWEPRFQQYIKAIKKSNEWTDLADFYIALLYMLGLQRNDLSDSLNRTIGREMILTLDMLDNPYAKRFIKTQ